MGPPQGQDIQVALAREICRLVSELAVDFLAANDEKLNSQQIWLTDLNSFLFSEPPVILQNFLASDFDFSIFQAIFPFVLLFFSPTPLFLNNMPPKTSRLVPGKADEVPRKTAKESHLLSPNTKSQAKVDQQEAKKKEKRQATIKLHRTDHPKSNEQGNNGEAEPEQEHDSDSNFDSNSNSNANTHRNNQTKSNEQNNHGEAEPGQDHNSNPNCNSNSNSNSDANTHRNDQPKSNEQHNNGEAGPEREHNSNSNDMNSDPHPLQL